MRPRQASTRAISVSSSKQKDHLFKERRMINGNEPGSVPYCTSLLDLGLLHREIERHLDQVAKLKHCVHCILHCRFVMSFCLLSLSASKPHRSANTRRQEDSITQLAPESKPTHASYHCQLSKAFPPQETRDSGQSDAPCKCAAQNAGKHGRSVGLTCWAPRLLETLARLKMKA